MKTKLLMLCLCVLFVGLYAQKKEGAKLQKADESGFLNVDSPPSLISELKPVYPDDAKIEGLEGTVYLKLLIDEKGNVAKTKIEQGIKDVLDNSALEAAKKAKFSPALLKNKPVKVWVVLPIAFKLEAGTGEKQAAANPSGEPGMNDFVTVEKLPEMVNACKPEYPEAAKTKEITGKIYVKVLVDREGNPKKAVVIKSDNEIFNQPAIDAALKSKFTPALHDQKPTPVWIVLPYRFTLGDNDKKENGQSERFETQEKANEYFDGSSGIVNMSPDQRSKIGNIDKEIEISKVETDFSYGDDFLVYKSSKGDKSKFHVILRKGTLVYRYIGDSLPEIKGYVDGLQKSSEKN